MSKAISGVWQLTEEERIREQCQAREEWEINNKWKMDKIKELRNELDNIDREKEESAIEMLRDGVSDEKVAKYLNFSAERIQELKNSLE